MLYCADKHKMACFVFTAYRCCLRALFLLSAALCCLAHTADLRQEEADDNQKQTRSTLQKTRPMRNMYVHHAATLCAWYHHAAVASELRLRSFSINSQFTSVLRSLVVETTARRPIRKQTQIVGMPKNMKVRQPTSHTSRVL